MKRHKAVIIGCGARGKAETLAGKLGVTPYVDSEAMIRAVKPDIVHIATPPTARYDLLALASDMGVPACTVEKPLAVGVPDWRTLCTLAERTSTKIAVCHQFRWHTDFTRCREALASGRLGRLLFLDISAGMNISGQGTHLLNYGFALNGDSPAVRVFGYASGADGMQGYHPGPDTTEGYLVFENGVRALWNNGTTAPKTGDPATDWQHVRLAAYAEEGRVLWEEFGKWEIVRGSGIESGDFGNRDIWLERNLGAQAAFHRAMLAWADGSGPPAGTNLSQSLHEWKTVLALYYSALVREPVEIGPFDPPDDLFEQLKAAFG